MNTMIVYQSAAAYEMARAWVREFASTPTSLCLAETAWKLDLLRMPALCNVAASDAAQARWIIVAFEALWDVPQELENWLSAWSQTGIHSPHTLVAYRARTETSEASSIGRRLVKRLALFASESGLEFMEAGTGVSDCEERGETEAEPEPPLLFLTTDYRGPS